MQQKECNKKNATKRMQRNACSKKNATKSMQQKESDTKNSTKKIECTKQNACFQVLQGAGLYGAGDFLMSFLGVIILSFAFKIFDQRRLMVRHALRSWAPA